MAFSLTKEQQAVVDDRGGALLVSAAAGSGKTRVLVERLLARVTGEGLDIDRFLIITYTKAAAAELRSRIVEELSARLAEAPTAACAASPRWSTRRISPPSTPSAPSFCGSAAIPSTWTRISSSATRGRRGC